MPEENPDITNPDAIMVGSIISNRTGKGLVQMEWAGKTVQLSTTEARTLAGQIFEAAECAESDQIMYAVGMEINNDQQMALAFIQLIRNKRDEHYKARKQNGE